MDSRFVTIFVFCAIYHHTYGDPASSFTTTKISPKPLWNATYTDQLRQDLLLNYDKFARPTQHYNKTTIHFGVSIRHIEINEFKSTITVHSWCRMLWFDDKLKWNVSNYGNLSLLHLAEHEIWQPDIFLYNSATASSINHYGNTPCLVYPNGEILWVPPAQFVAMCEFNLKYWPFDTQKCTLKFGSWTYHGNSVDLILYANKSEAEIELVATNTEWEIEEATLQRSVKYYACCPEPYPDVMLNITLRRVSPSYKAVIITPSFAIIILTLAGFWLPPQAGEKIILNGCLAIMVSLFLLYFAQKLPALGNHTPLIVFFFSSSLYIICFAMFNAIVVLWISRTQHTKALPWIIKQPLTGCIGRWLGLGHYIAETSMNFHRAAAEEMRDHQVTDFEEQNTNEDHHIMGVVMKTPLQQDWILLAVAIDRISFLFYTFLFIVLALSYSI